MKKKKKILKNGLIKNPKTQLVELWKKGKLIAIQG